ncbi:unnamed protein product [Symbiodinium natans]|uniref:Uncharacterized protein n=1 Tax=Symbiodinium natans TaxID=878477 RepID=A0A812TYF8_9DINO|nr:unnamed protein product [Symbiodinium natans]
MGNLDSTYATVQSLYLVVLDVLTALLLAASLVKYCRKYGWARVAHRAGQQFGRCRAWLADVQDPDPQVAQKLQVALCQLLVRCSRILGIFSFLWLVTIQWYHFRNEAYKLQPMDFTYMLAYPVSMFCVVCQRAVKPTTLDVFYALNQLLYAVPIWLAPAADIKYLAGLTLLPRLFAGLSAKHVALPLCGHVLHSLLVLKCQHFQAPVDVGLQAAELVGLFAGTWLVRRQLHTSVQLSLDLKSRQIELEAISNLLLGLCDSVVELDEDLRLTEDSRQLSTTLLSGEPGSRGGLAGSEFIEFFCPEDRTAVQTALCQAAVGLGRAPLKAVVFVTCQVNSRQTLGILHIWLVLRTPFKKSRYLELKGSEASPAA